MNKVFLQGRLGADPVVRYTQQGTPVCSFSLATDEYYKRNGDGMQITEWHNIVVYATLAEICSKYLKKGREVLVEGKIRTDKWKDMEGADRMTKKIIASYVKFFKAGDSVGAGEDLPPGEDEASMPNGSIPDEDIPF